MLRLTHSQVGQGPLLISDIDDGLPNKTARRGVGHPKKYQRDGNSPGGSDKSTKPGSSALKQKCYIPRTKAGEPTVAGYIDVAETDRVLMSQARGVIKGMQTAGLLSVTSFVATDVAAPTVTSVLFNAPSAGDVTITGTNMTSLAPDITSVTLSGTGAVALTQSQITTGSGTVSDTSIVLKAATVPGIAELTTTLVVRADGQSTVSYPVALRPTLATAALSGGTLTLTGTRMTSSGPWVTGVTITGSGAVTLTATQILAAGGTVGATSVVIPPSLIPGVATTSSSVVVTSNNLSSTPAVAVS